MELEKARDIAEKIEAVLESSCERIMIAGSIRRRKPDVGDIELLCIPYYTHATTCLPPAYTPSSSTGYLASG